MDRRHFLGRITTALAAGTIAGCGSPAESSGGQTPTPAYADASTVDVPAAAATYLEDVSNFDGTALDLTDHETVSVVVGAEGNGNYWAFEPAAIQISTGTTVIWQWNGRGGAHNVVSKDGEGPLDSGASVLGSDVTYSYTFESTGTYLYECVPHEPMGMKGAVLVVA
jgi:halocyanin-like protein